MYPHVNFSLSAAVFVCHVKRSQFIQPHFILGRLSPLRGKPVIVHILLPETDNCPS